MVFGFKILEMKKTRSLKRGKKASLEMELLSKINI